MHYNFQCWVIFSKPQASFIRNFHSKSVALIWIEMLWSGDGNYNNNGKHIWQQEDQLVCCLNADM